MRKKIADGISSSNKNRDDSYLLYVLLCADGTYYTGITTSLKKRLLAHRSGKGAKYVKHRLPVRLQKTWGFFTKSEALRMEYAFKQCSRKGKERLLQQDSAWQEFQHRILKKNPSNLL